MRMHNKVFGLCQGYLFDPWNTCDRGELNLAHNAIFWYIKHATSYINRNKACYKLHDKQWTPLTLVQVEIDEAACRI